MCLDAALAGSESSRASQDGCRGRHPYRFTVTFVLDVKQYGRVDSAQARSVLSRRTFVFERLRGLPVRKGETC